MKKIMFVCTGNICRSAIAEIMLKKLAEEKNKEIEVHSCGTFAENGAMSTLDAIQVLKEDYNLDLYKHRATNIYDADIANSDLVLCATNIHKITVLHQYPDLYGKVYTIKEYAKANEESDLDISDPWGGSIATYRKCASEIYDLLQKIIDKI